MGKKSKKKKQKGKQSKKPTKYGPEALKLFRELWGIKIPTSKKPEPPRTKEETFRLLKSGKIKLKEKPNRLVTVEYETEGTDDALKREKSRYIKDSVKTGPIKKRKIKKEYVFIRGADKKGGLEYWKVGLTEKPYQRKEHCVTPLIYQSILGNGRYNISRTINLIHELYDLRHNSGDRHGVYDRMPDELLSLFDENVKNEDGSLRRYTTIECLDLDHDAVMAMVEPLRTPISQRLKKFEEERNERKRSKPMTENEKQKYVRKYKADEAKRNCLNILLKYFNDHLNLGKPEMIENEAALCKEKLAEFRAVVSSVVQKILEKMDHYKKAILKREIDDALNMRRKALEEQINMTATRKENEMQYGYNNVIFPAKFMEQKQSFQLDMSSYIQYWAKKTREIENKVDIQKRYLRKHTETKKTLQAAEHIPAIKRAFTEKVKETEEEGKLLIEAALQPLEKKTEMLENIRTENQALLNSIDDYVLVIPEFLKKLKEFIKYTKAQSVERKQFLEALNNIEVFRQKLLLQSEEFQKFTISESSSSKENISRTLSNIAIIEASEKEESEIVFDLAHKILSDGELDKDARQLLKVKFIISDLLKRVIETHESKQSKEYTIEGIRKFNTVINVTETNDETYISKSDKRNDSFCVLDKLQQINKQLDVAFEIDGDKYSIPDLLKVGEYLNKRTASVDKMLEKHRNMLENI